MDMRTRLRTSSAVLVAGVFAAADLAVHFDDVAEVGQPVSGAGNHAVGVGVLAVV